MNFNYMYSGGIDSGLESIASSVFMIYAVCIVIYGLVSLASYVFRAIGFYTIGKSQGDENAWLAFIPIVRRYQQGRLAGNILLKEKTMKNTGIWFACLPVAWGILSYLVSMIMGISIVGKIIRYGIMASYNSYGVAVKNVIEGLLGFIIIYVILAIAYKVIYKLFVILVDKSILERYTTGNMPIIHAVFCAMIPLYESICVFVVSRRIKAEEDEKKQTENMYYNMAGSREFSQQGMYTQGYVVNPMQQQSEQKTAEEQVIVSDNMNEFDTENKISEE